MLAVEYWPEAYNAALLEIKWRPDNVIQNAVGISDLCIGKQLISSLLRGLLNCKCVSPREKMTHLNSLRRRIAICVLIA